MSLKSYFFLPFSLFTAEIAAFLHIAFMIWSQLQKLTFFFTSKSRPKFDIIWSNLNLCKHTRKAKIQFKAFFFFSWKQGCILDPLKSTGIFQLDLLDPCSTLHIWECLISVPLPSTLATQCFHSPWILTWTASFTHCTLILVFLKGHSCKQRALAFLVVCSQGF